MAVIDASVMVDALVAVGAGGETARNELRRHNVLQVPAIFGAEVASALRGLILRKHLSLVRADRALVQIETVRVLRYPFEPLSGRVWQLRENATVYDSWYVALAESLDTDLVTNDRRLLGLTGVRCRVRPPES